jgi:hypothetical protein
LSSISLARIIHTGDEVASMNSTDEKFHPGYWKGRHLPPPQI